MVDGEAIAIGICCRSELRAEVDRVLNSPLMVFSLFSLIFLIIYVYNIQCSLVWNLIDVKHVVDFNTVI